MAKVIYIVFRRLLLVNYLCLNFECNNRCFNFKSKMMKKLFFILVVLISVAAIFSSCETSRKSGCPMNEKIIH